MPINIGSNKIVMFDFWNDYMKPKCREKAKSHYIANDVEARFDTWNERYYLNEKVKKLLDWWKMN